MQTFWYIVTAVFAVLFIISVFALAAELSAAVKEQREKAELEALNRIEFEDVDVGDMRRTVRRLLKEDKRRPRKRHTQIIIR